MIPRTSHPLKTTKRTEDRKIEGTNHPLHVINRIEVLKEIHPAWSNGDILTQLKNEGVSISCSTIGRIMKRLKTSGHSRKAYYCIGCEE